MGLPGHVSRLQHLCCVELNYGYIKNEKLPSSKQALTLDNFISLFHERRIMMRFDTSVNVGALRFIN